MIFFILPLLIFANTILNYNINEKEDRVEFILYFDTPFKEKIFFKEDKNITEIILPNTKIEENSTDLVNTNFLYKYEIFSRKDDTLIKLFSYERVKIKAVRDGDFKIKFLIVPNYLEIKAFDKEEKEDFSIGRYMFVLFLLLLALATILFFKKKELNQISGIKLIEIQPIDRNTKAIVLKYFEKKYLIIIGNNFASVVDRVDEREFEFVNVKDFPSLEDEKIKKYLSKFEEIGWEDLV